MTLFEEFNKLRLTKNLEESLKELSKEHSLNSVSKILSKLDDSSKEELNIHFQKLKISNNPKKNLLFLRYIFGTLNFCKVCGTACFGAYCSNKCSNADPEIKSKAMQHRKENNIKKYGVENCMKIDSVMRKLKDSNLKKYGTDSYFKTDEFKEKSKLTKLERYNNANYVNLEKLKDSNLKKYGTDSYFKTDEFKEKSKLTKLERYNNANYVNLEKRKKTNIEKYGFESALKSPEIRDKIKKTIFEKYGVDNISVLDSIKQKKIDSSIKKYGVLNPNQKHLKNYNNLNINFIKNKFKSDPNSLQNFMDYYNCGTTFALDWLYKAGLRDIHSGSVVEDALFNFIPCENKIKRCRKLIDHYELDIVLPDVKLAIEYNGSYWHSSNNVDKKYHLKKTELCEEKGYQLFHIFDFDDIDIWKSMILNKLKLNKVIYARKCIIKEINSKIASEFLDENHIQGSVSSSIRLGLYYNDELVEVMTFGKPRFNKGYNFELLRLCTRKYYNVVGGASKLFKYFTSKYKGNIISYANRRFSQGNIYGILGFKKIGVSEPNFWYSDCSKVLTRYQCQKHRLPKLLEKFDENLSEEENMKINGYFRIYDSGNIVYEFNQSVK